MRIKFTKDITCVDSVKCSQEILNKIESKITRKIHADNEFDTVEGHLSIIHEKEKHTIWLFLYDDDGIHESDINQKHTKTPNNPRCKKFSGIIPTQTEIEIAIE